jgi:TonB family protein
VFQLFRMSSTRLSCLIVAAIASCAAANVSAESLPQMRPALIGSGPGSLVNLIDAQALFQKGQRDAWVMFECGVAGDGVVYGSDFFTASPDAGLLKNEVRRRLRQTTFIPAVYNHKRTSAWFQGTVVFVVANGKPHLRIYANQDLDEIKRGADFVAPQLIYVPNHYITDLPTYPTVARHGEAAGVVKLRHSVDANGKTTDVQVISEPPGYQLGDYLKKAVPLLDFSPGYRNGRPTTTTYTLTWWFGRTVGW